MRANPPSRWSYVGSPSASEREAVLLMGANASVSDYVELLDAAPDRKTLDEALREFHALLPRGQADAELREALQKSRALCQLAMAHPLLAGVVLTPFAVADWGDGPDQTRTTRLRREAIATAIRADKDLLRQLCNLTGVPKSMSPLYASLPALLALARALGREPDLRGALKPGASHECVEAVAIIDRFHPGPAPAETLRWAFDQGPLIMSDIKDEERRDALYRQDAGPPRAIAKLMDLIEAGPPEIEQGKQFHPGLYWRNARKRANHLANQRRKAKDNARRGEELPMSKKALALLGATPGAIFRDGWLIELASTAGELLETGRLLNQCFDKSHGGLYVWEATQGDALFAWLYDAAGKCAAVMQILPPDRDHTDYSIHEALRPKNRDVNADQYFRALAWVRRLNALSADARACTESVWIDDWESRRSS